MAVRGDASVTLFAPPALLRAAELAREIDRAPMYQVIAGLTRLTHYFDLAASAWLHIGVVNAALGRHEEALINLDKAMQCRRERGSATGTDIDEESDIVRWPDAHYHRGRILIEAGRYEVAVDELSDAVRQDNSNARAHYHLARAIRLLIEQDLQQEAQASADRYLDLDAPLGLTEDIDRFVGGLFVQR